MKDISTSVLNQIQTKEIKPISKSTLLVKYILEVLLLVGLWVSGALFFSMTYYVFATEHRLFTRELRIHFIWILLFLLFIYFSSILIKKFRNYYKFHLFWLLLISFLISISLGVLLHHRGVNQRTDQLLADRFPLYKGINNLREERWNKPEEGRLAGIIRKEDGFYYLEDLKGEKWLLENGDESELSSYVGKQVRLLGTAENLNNGQLGMPLEKEDFKALVLDLKTFKVKRVAPWIPKGILNRMKEK